MEVRIWRSFSCNNSGSFYLVAEFSDPAAAEASAQDLAAFFATHAQQVDDMFEADQDPMDTPSAVSTEFALKHGFDWGGEFLVWGDDLQVGDEPEVAAVGNAVVVYHSYCGGFGDGLPNYFKAIGAECGEEIDDSPDLSVVLTVPPGADGQQLSDNVGAFFLQDGDLDEEMEKWPVRPPWGEKGTASRWAEADDIAYFCDGHTLGFVVPFGLDGLDELRAYLSTHKVTDYQFAYGKEHDLVRFRAIASAACSECQSTELRFLDAAAHNAPEDQLACQSCGGMFALSGFIKQEE